MAEKKPSRRQALREFSAKQRPQQGCRRMTGAEAGWRTSQDEVERGFRWAWTLRASIDELQALRDRGGYIN